MMGVGAGKRENRGNANFTGETVMRGSYETGNGVMFK